jgi:hypothetical protein
MKQEKQAAHRKILNNYFSLSKNKPVLSFSLRRRRIKLQTIIGFGWVLISVTRS